MRPVKLVLAPTGSRLKILSCNPLDEPVILFDDIVEMTTFHIGLGSHIQEFISVKDRYVKEPYPAWTAVGTTELAIPGAVVEIKVIAHI